MVDTVIESVVRKRFVPRLHSIEARLERRHISTDALRQFTMRYQTSHPAELLLQIQDGIPFAVPAGRSNGTENVQCHRSGSRGCIAEGEWKILLVETPVI